jgi:uncharacterized protein (TIGR00299 family) protein
LIQLAFFGNNGRLVPDDDSGQGTRLWWAGMWSGEWGMKILYLDCASGISGDMMLGALVDAGVDLAEIQAGVDSLGVAECRLECASVKRHSFRATKLTVQHPEQKAHRHLHHITDMIARSRLTAAQQDLAVRIFTRLGEAEAKVHGSTLQRVHFHEVGALDSIADIVGAAIGIDLLGVDRIVCSPVPTGSGYIQIAHGRVSVPAPATAELLTGIPLAESPVVSELTTPTGAAIVATVAHAFGPLPAMRIEKIGYGAGDRDFQEQANILRILLGHDAGSVVMQDQVTVLETNLDQATAEVIGHCAERLMAEGALDVFTTPIQMKKNRPACLLTVLCSPADEERLEAILFAESLTLGVRRWRADRRKLPREAVELETPWGVLAGKRIQMPDGSTRVAPEYDACRAVAQAHNLPLQAIMDVAKHAPIR